MIRSFHVLVFLMIFAGAKAQLIDVQYNYNNIGDCIFGASNNTKMPLFLYLYFESLENTYFTEPMPYVKKLEPGYTGLFTLQREVDRDAPNFIFKTKTYRSNPLATVNLDFPYLVPFEPGTKVKSFDVKNIDGFWGNKTPESWRATGFFAQPGHKVYTARQGVIVEVAGEPRNTKPELWVHAWTNAVTLLQPDGTLITYKNVIDREGKLEINKTIQAGEILGEVAENAGEIILLIYHHTLDSTEPEFIIPVFATSPGKTEIINPTLNIEVVHPLDIVSLEMSKRGQKKLLKKK
jgi:hypothetical protein